MHVVWLAIMIVSSLFLFYCMLINLPVRPGKHLSAQGEKLHVSGYDLAVYNLDIKKRKPIKAQRYGHTNQ